MNRELRTAIERGDLTASADLATKLDDAVQAGYKAWLIRDADQLVDQALRWLPPDTESVWVNQEPFTINSDESMALLYGRPVQVYSLERLSALNEGKLVRELTHITVRLVIAGARNLRPSSPGGIPGPGAATAVAYFYFFSKPVDLQQPDEGLENRPVWRGVASIDAGEPIRPGVKRTNREDENWLALVRPDVLVLASSKQLLAEIVSRIDHQSKTRALPQDLPEWKHVNRHASFWGLRHYTDRSKPKPEEREFTAAYLPNPDGMAQGVAVQFDTSVQRLEVLYLSNGQLAQQGPGNSVHRQFQIDQPLAGVWRLVSDIQKRGPWPVHFAFSMLGFGMYR